MYTRRCTSSNVFQEGPEVSRRESLVVVECFVHFHQQLFGSLVFSGALRCLLLLLQRLL
jgi:hypothetical protein